MSDIQLYFKYLLPFIFLLFGLNIYLIFKKSQKLNDNIFNIIAIFWIISFWYFITNFWWYVLDYERMWLENRIWENTQKLPILLMIIFFFLTVFYKKRW